jgi:hypothetical protein
LLVTGELDCNLQSISASIQGSIPEKAAGSQAKFILRITELLVSSPGEFPKQRSLEDRFSDLSDLRERA